MLRKIGLYGPTGEPRGSRPGRSGVIVLPGGGNGGPGALAILQGW